MRNIKLLIISISMIILNSCGSTKTIVKHEFVMSDTRSQAIVDSLTLQIKECEGALRAWTKVDKF